VHTKPLAIQVCASLFATNNTGTFDARVRLTSSGAVLTPICNMKFDIHLTSVCRLDLYGRLELGSLTPSSP